MAPVIDLEQRRRRGAQLGRGQARRVNPGLRGPRLEMVVDWEAYGELDRATVVSIEKGGRRPPLKPGGSRRTGRRVRNLRGPWSRQARRVAWKLERRLTGEKVAWRDSKAAGCRLAPIIPIRKRGFLARLRAQLPQGLHRSGRDLMDGAA